MDVRKKVEKRKNELRVHIAAIKVTASQMSPKVMNFEGAQKQLKKTAVRLQRELDMLEETWKW